VLGQSNGNIDIFSQGSYKRLSQLSFINREINKEDQLTFYFSQNETQIIGIVKGEEEITIYKWSSISFQLLESLVLQGGYDTYVIPGLNLLGVIKERTLLLQSLNYLEDTATITLPGWLSTTFLDSFGNNSGQTIPSTNGDFILMNDRFSITHWEISYREMTYNLNDYPLESTNLCYDAPPTCYNINGEFSWQCEDEIQNGPIETIALSPDSMMFIISTNQGKTEMRHADDGKLVWEIDTMFTEIIFSPDGNAFYGVREDGVLEKRNALDGALTNVLAEHPSKLFDIAFSPDSSVIAAGFNDGWIRVYSILDGSMLGVLPGNALSLSFSPDGALLGAGLIDGTIRIYKLMEGENYDLPIHHKADVTDLEFSMTGNKLLTASMDCTLNIWDVINRNRILITRVDFVNPYPITAAAFSIDEEQWYAAGISPNITAGIGFETQNTPLPSLFGCNEIALSLNGLWLSAAGEQTWLMPLDQTGSITEATSLESDSYENYALAFSPDSEILASVDSKSIYFFSPFAKNLLHKISLQPGFDMQPLSLVFSPSGTMIALGGSNGLITIYAIP
jgi:WD40 repeat protein